MERFVLLISLMILFNKFSLNLVVQEPTPKYSSHLELDLSTVVPSLAGPKRPEDRVTLANLPTEFQEVFP